MREQRVERAHRVAVDRAGVEPAQQVGALRHAPDRAGPRCRAAATGPTAGRPRSGSAAGAASPRACAPRLRDGADRPGCRCRRGCAAASCRARERPGPARATGSPASWPLAARKARSLSILSISRVPTSLRYQAMPHMVLSRWVWPSTRPGSSKAPPPSSTAQPVGTAKSGRRRRSARPGPKRRGLAPPEGAHCGSEVSHARQLGWNESCACQWRHGRISSVSDANQPEPQLVVRRLRQRDAFLRPPR